MRGAFCNDKMFDAMTALSSKYNDTPEKARRTLR